MLVSKYNRMGIISALSNLAPSIISNYMIILCSLLNINLVIIHITVALLEIHLFFTLTAGGRVFKNTAVDRLYEQWYCSFGRNRLIVFLDLISCYIIELPT